MDSRFYSLTDMVQFLHDWNDRLEHLYYRNNPMHQESHWSWVVWVDSGRPDGALHG